MGRGEDSVVCEALPAGWGEVLVAPEVRGEVLAAGDYAAFDAVLQVCARAEAEAAPCGELFAAAARRRGEAGREAPCGVTLVGGTAVGRVVVETEEGGEGEVFGRHEKVRAALAPLLALAPRRVAVDVRVPDWRGEAVYAALVAAARLPAAVPRREAPAMVFAGRGEGGDVADAVAAARANTLARALTLAPPNVLTPAVFAAYARRLAAEVNAGGAAVVRVTVYGAARLQKMGAGAIAAVGRAAVDHPPMVVHVAVNPRAVRRLALVGKGVCYDTGGVNVKPARYMRGMGGDMAGAAAALAAGLAAAPSGAGVDVWLALADNSIAHNAYRPDEVVTALNGKRIEIVHSDAEGRMILADTLTLAGRRRPRALVSFATLTGTMCTALGTRMSGFFATDAAWREAALRAAAASGERLCFFPMPADYKEGLKSGVADIKQCAEEGDADHILAAVFLREFIEGGRGGGGSASSAPAWVHVDLSAAACKGGLGAAPGEVTGFGAAWGLALVRQWARRA